MSLSSLPASFCLVLLAVMGLGGCAGQSWQGLGNLTQIASDSKDHSVKVAADGPVYKPPAHVAPNPNPVPPLTVHNTPNPQIIQASMTMSAPAAHPPRPAKIQVALLLPLSGKNAALGQSMLNAAQLAVFDIAAANFEIMPKDTGGTASGSSTAAREAIANGAQLLIGPLFASDVAAVKPQVQTSNVNMLALSTDVSLAEPGVYVMGFAPGPQVERIVAYGSDRGLRRFAAVVPATAYGHLVQTAFESAVRRQGGSVVAVKTPAQLNEIIAIKDKIDAILLPLGGDELRQVASQLAAGGIDRSKVKMLGTGLWDEPDLGLKSETLIGGWYPAAEPQARETFMRNYRNSYGQEPPRLATLTYDATALAAVLAAREGKFDRTALTNPNGFAGLDGIFRLTSKGLAERGLAINEVDGAGNKVVDPSPSTFTASY